MLGSYHLGKICLPGETSVRIRGSLMTIVSGGSRRILDGLRQPLDSLVIKDNGKPMLRLDLLRGPFGSFMLAYLLFYTFQYVTLPLFPLYNVNLLHLTDGDISLGTAFFYIVMTVVSLGLNRVSARRGPRSLLVLGSLLFGAFPLLMYLARDAGLYLAANIAGGGIWAVLNAGLVNRLMERVPENDRPAHMALHNIALNLGILAGSMIGPLFVSQVGLRDVILIGAGLRLVGGLLMVIWG
jgi:predicted MFS family arabinose efflux permease